MTMGVWFADEVSDFYRVATGDIKGSFNDFKLSCLVKHGTKDKDGRTEILPSAGISKFHMCLFFDSFSLG